MRHDQKIILSVNGLSTEKINLPVTIILSNQKLLDAYNKILRHLLNNFSMLKTEIIVPEIPEEISTPNFLISIAMKRACINNQRVILIGYDKQEIGCKEFQCKRFNEYICMLSSPIQLSDLLLEIFKAEINHQSLKCEKYCSVFFGDGFEICSEKYFNENFYHDLIKNFVPRLISEQNGLSIFNSIADKLRVFKLLFIPPYDQMLIDQFMQGLIDLQKIANENSYAEFIEKYDEFMKTEYMDEIMDLIT